MTPIRLLLAMASCIFFASYFYFHNAGRQVLPAKVDGYSLIKKSCEFDIDWKADVTCAVLRTPAGGGGFQLKVAILRDGSRKRRPDPVVYLQGGPGMAAGINKSGIAHWLRWMDLAQLQRDVILVDPRGTGASLPKLECAEFNRFNRELLKISLTLDEELFESRNVTATCFDRLAKKGMSAQQFGSLQSAEDVRALMSLLNYPQWNILAVSYGTRLALEIARQEELEQGSTRLKSMVLDSVYPAGYGGVMTWPEVLDTAMQQFFNGCEFLSACAELLPLLGEQSLQQVFMEELAHLQQQPLMLTIHRWDGGVPVDFMVNDHRFLSASFAAIYTPQQWPIIVEVLVAFKKLRSQPFGSRRVYREAVKALVEPYLNRSFSEDFNSLTFSAVDCADNSLGTANDYDQGVAKFSEFRNYTKAQWRNQICHELYTEGTTPLSLQIPQFPGLLLSGVLDPVTPSHWAKELLIQWPKAQLVQRAHVAHSVLASDLCLLQQLSAFFDEPHKKFIACTEGALK